MYRVCAYYPDNPSAKPGPHPVTELPAPHRLQELGSEARNFALATGSLNIRESFSQAALPPSGQTLPPLLHPDRQYDSLAPLSSLSQSMLVPVACTTSWFLIFLTPHLATLTQCLFPQCLLPCPVDLSLCSRGLWPPLPLPRGQGPVTSPRPHCKWRLGMLGGGG